MPGKQLVLVIPGDISTQTGGYIYDRRLIAELEKQGWSVSHISLGDSFPQPNQRDLEDAKSKLAKVNANSTLIIDGLVMGSLPPELVKSLPCVVVALIHHPLAYEGNLDTQLREKFFQIEQENIKNAKHVIVPSAHTSKLLRSEYGISDAKITVAEPGIDFFECNQKKLQPPLILSVGIQIFRKGHDVLLSALSQITHLPWQAAIVGSVQDEDVSTALHKLMGELGLGDRVIIEGGVSASKLHKLYCQASLFALATRYEGYGMVFAEAMSYGLPIISCDTGAVSETVAKGVGKLVPKNDADSFAEALASVLQNKTSMDAMAVASLTAGGKLDSWKQTASKVGLTLATL